MILWCNITLNMSYSQILSDYTTKWRGTAKFLIIVDFPDFWKVNGWNALTLWTPISCCAPGLLSNALTLWTPISCCAPGLISHTGILMTFYLSIILDLQNFFHWYILQSWKLKRPPIQLRPHHFFSSAPPFCCLPCVYF
jgi:glucose-6-phosphate-specific signal transduction histidine kinase